MSWSVKGGGWSWVEDTPAAKPWDNLEDPHHVPDYPPSQLVCTPREWAFFFKMGKMDHDEGRIRIYPKDAPHKGKSVWEDGWDQARNTHQD